MIYFWKAPESILKPLPDRRYLSSFFLGQKNLLSKGFHVASLFFFPNKHDVQQNDKM